MKVLIKKKARGGKTKTMLVDMDPELYAYLEKHRKKGTLSKNDEIRKSGIVDLIKMPGRMPKSISKRVRAFGKEDFFSKVWWPEKKRRSFGRRRKKGVWNWDHLLTKKELEAKLKRAQAALKKAKAVKSDKRKFSKRRRRKRRRRSFSRRRRRRSRLKR